MAVVLVSNIVRMALCLMVSLGATSGLFFLAGADFVGAMQLLIYVGGTLVLLIFGVMLTAQGPFISMNTGGGDWIVAAFCRAACLPTGAGGILDRRLAQPAAGRRAWRRGGDDHDRSRRTRGGGRRSHAARGKRRAQFTTKTVMESPTCNRRRRRRWASVCSAPASTSLDQRRRELRPGMSGYLLPFESFRFICWSC